MGTAYIPHGVRFSAQVDMNAPNQYVCCLALCTMANTCSAEMARDLSSEVEKLLKSSNALIRKKVRTRLNCVAMSKLLRY
jgi:hypothetical protein